MNPYKLARYEAGLSLAEAVERSGIAKNTIMTLERGETVRPNAPTVKKLADAYGVTVRVLLGEGQAA